MSRMWNDNADKGGLTVGRKKLGHKQYRISEDEADLIIVMRACRLSPANLLSEISSKLPLMNMIYDERRRQREIEQQGQTEGKC